MTVKLVLPLFSAATRLPIWNSNYNSRDIKACVKDERPSTPTSNHENGQDIQTQEVDHFVRSPSNAFYPCFILLEF
jgi:hypothetical protein